MIKMGKDLLVQFIVVFFCSGAAALATECNWQVVVLVVVLSTFVTSIFFVENLIWEQRVRQLSKESLQKKQE